MCFCQRPNKVEGLKYLKGYFNDVVDFKFKHACWQDTWIYPWKATPRAVCERRKAPIRSHLTPWIEIGVLNKSSSWFDYSPPNTIKKTIIPTKLYSCTRKNNQEAPTEQMTSSCSPRWLGGSRKLQARLLQNAVASFPLISQRQIRHLPWLGE